MKKLTLFISLIFLLSLTANGFAQEERKPSIAENELTQIYLTVSGSSIRIQNADRGDTLEIYNILGVKVSSTKIDSLDKTINLNLPKGCYILKIENTVRKIAIK